MEDLATTLVPRVCSCMKCRPCVPAQAPLDASMECKPCMPLWAPADDFKIELTVKLLAGDHLATLTAGPRTVVRELKQRLEAACQSTGRAVRDLVWGARHLQDEEMLQDLGIRSGAELLAICVDGIEGLFEVYEPGCPTCDFNADLQRIHFDLDGTAMIQNGPHDTSKAYRYFLVEVQGHKMHLEFVDEDVTPAKVYSGILQMSATSRIDRRVRIPELDIDVQDVRYLKEQGRAWVQLKVEQLLFMHEGNMGLAFNAAAYYDHILPPSDDVAEAFTRAWRHWKVQYEEVQEKDEMAALGELLLRIREPQIHQKPPRYHLRSQEQKAKHAPRKRDTRPWRREREEQKAKRAPRKRDTCRWSRERGLRPEAQLEFD